MFKYWQGYEIDGSDTSFNIVVPNREALREVAAFYLSLPLWDRSRGMTWDAATSDVWAPHRDEELQSPFDADAVLASIESPDWGGEGYLVTGCLDPELLEGDLKREVYALSSTRPGEEEPDYRGVHPGVGLGRFYDAFNVGLIFGPRSSVQGYYVDDEGTAINRGMILNAGALDENARRPDRADLSLTCGPSFIYEYAAYIVTKLVERFPEIGIDGGLDCAGGFTEGCTYSTGLYACERFLFETESVADLTERLIRGAVVRPLMRASKGQHNFEYRFDGARLSMVQDYRKTRTCASYDAADYEREVRGLWKENANPLAAKHACAAFVSVDLEGSEKPEWGSFAYLTAWPDGAAIRMELQVPRAARAETERRLREAGIAFS